MMKPYKKVDQHRNLWSIMPAQQTTLDIIHMGSTGDNNAGIK